MTFIRHLLSYADIKDCLRNKNVKKTVMIFKMCEYVTLFMVGFKLGHTCYHLLALASGKHRYIDVLHVSMEASHEYCASV